MSTSQHDTPFPRPTSRPIPASATIVQLLPVSGPWQAVYADASGKLACFYIIGWALLHTAQGRRGVAGLIARPPQAPGDINLIARADLLPRFVGYTMRAEPEHTHDLLAAVGEQLVIDGLPTDTKRQN